MKIFLKYITIIVFAFCTFTSLAQTGESKKDKIDAARADFIKKNVPMTEQEQQAFWPLYNEMMDKLEVARKTFRKQYNAKKDYNFTTDNEAEAYVNAELALKQKEYEIQKEYVEKFKKILPIKKVAAVKRAEDEFKKVILDKVKGG